ncbi:hypothetical protein GGR77_003392 [Xanthomonas translucens]
MDGEERAEGQAVDALPAVLSCSIMRPVPGLQVDATLAFARVVNKRCAGAAGGCCSASAASGALCSTTKNGRLAAPVGFGSWYPAARRRPLSSGNAPAYTGHPPTRRGRPPGRR